MGIERRTLSQRNEILLESNVFLKNELNSMRGKIASLDVDMNERINTLTDENKDLHQENMLLKHKLSSLDVMSRRRSVVKFIFYFYSYV